MCLMRISKGNDDTKDPINSSFLQVYQSLPPPQNHKQFSELLAWLDKDRDRVFTHAKFSDVSKYIYRGLMSLVAFILVFATSERTEAIKWILKLLSPFIK